MIARSLVTAALVAASLPSMAYDQNQFVFGLSAHNAFDSNDELGVQAEWRGKRFDDSMIGVSNISPQVGLLVDIEGDVYAYGGFLYDWRLNERWSLVPNLSAGLYHDASDGIDLGGTVQFRSAIELTYTVAHDERIGLSLAHISNFGLYDQNPGTEIVTVNYSWGY